MAIQKPRVKHPILLIALALTTTLLLTYSKWRPWEQTAYDYRIQVNEKLGLGHSRPTGNVVVVGIDEKTAIKEKPAIFLYSDIGRFLEKMKNEKASVIGIDIIPVHKLSQKFRNGAAPLYEPEQGSKQLELIENIGDRLDRSLLASIIKTTEKVPIIQSYYNDLLPFYYQSASFIRNLSLANVELTDGDKSSSSNIIRRQKLLLEGQNLFATDIYRHLTGKPVVKETIYLNYALTKNIPFYCFDDIMNDRINKDKLKGKAVILSYINGYEDLHATPLNAYKLPDCFSNDLKSRIHPKSRLVPGPVLHAVIIETMLTGTNPQEAPFALQMIILVLLAAAGYFFSTEFKPAYSLLIVLGITTAFLLTTVVFLSKGHILHVFPQVIAPFSILAFVYPYRYIVEERAKKKIYKMFGYYIDPEIIDSLLAQESVDLLKGEYKDVCILFLDIRDFTRLSSGQNATNIVGFLNLYFGKITATIKKHQGFVNKFIGDGMLAFFVTGQNPVENAVKASREILMITDDLNSNGTIKPFFGEWRLNIGIGIHYGKVVVGNIGSEQKMDFTIIGEPVNLASRIEGLTKQAKKTLLLSDTAYTMVKDQFELESVGRFAVKGVDQPVSVYTIRTEL
jgi:class 3 adenylate cyclase/CHASE2 domain-containing sensor protein